MATLLVVDDSADVRKLAVHALSGEHEVFAIDGWVQAAHYVMQYEIDLILLDINMPGLNGDKVAEILMKHVKSKPVNIVLFSTMDEAELRRTAKKVGAIGYIPKTFDGNFLQSRVRRFLKDLYRNNP
jgi:PleD family two-component response regulator